MVQIQKALRKNSEMVYELKGLAPDNKIPPKVISEGKI